MQAVVWHGPYDMRIDEVPDPTPAPGWVVVRPSVTGICGSDVTAYKGLMGVSSPGIIRGHEFAGTVVADDGTANAWTDHTVTVNPLVACGTCRYCRGGRDNLCPLQRSIGILLPGSLSEFVAVPVDNLVDVPSHVSALAAAGTEPLAQALHDVSVAERDGPLGSVLIIGAGSIGHFAVQVALLRGADTVSVLDPSPKRRSDAISVGATVAFDAPDEVESELAEGYDAVFDMVGTRRTRGDAVRWLCRGGTGVFVGLHATEDEVDWRSAIRRETTVRCSNASTAAEFRQAARWISDGSISPTTEPVTHPFASAPAVLGRLAEGDAPAAKTFIQGPGADARSDALVRCGR